ncbi:valine--tRNA ligase [Candidatus Woesearchaeota archaeon]|nr:valine--tRNA ligase [Candidatus Woesearchaeota archaeon]
MDLPKNYDFKESENKWKEYWEKNKIFKFDQKSKKPIFSIDTPPPTVSGKMHIGHAFSYSQQDFLARYKRMRGFNLFYPFGTDDNGLPTERLIEKLKGVKSKEMQRSEFIKLCLDTLKEITPNFIQDWKNIGVSSDYNLNYSTIDDNSRRISQKSFIDLFKQGRIYLKEFPTIWCPECQTAIAQAELEDKEKKSLFSTIRFKTGESDLLIATTRPELLGACVAVFINPKDKRYTHLLRKKAKVPLFGYEVPIIADSSADMEKGTGILMVCSFGDKYDVDSINRHKLTPRLIINTDGTLNIKPYQGIKIREARKKILEELQNKNLITNQKEISHAVNVHDKCGSEIEFITTEQWFIKIMDLKEELIKQGKNIKWHPDFMFKRYENWIKGLQWDWCISRQRHFGVPIPIWYCKKCNKSIIAQEKELPIDPMQTKKRCSCGEIAEGEKKVLDTWATSSVTPQICSSLVNKNIEIPFSLRNNAHDIIRTWDFYTITKSYLHEKKQPWKNIMISGFVTLEGEKMSKSKGNIIEPQKVIEQYGADALRFWAAGSKLGEDLDYQEKDIITGQRTITKLWNASKFSFMHLQDYKSKPKRLEAFDSWLLIKLNNIVKTSTETFESYEYSKTKLETENFFWNTFADFYLEIVKDRLYNPDKRGKEARISAQFILYHSLLNIIKLFAPIMPFITEDLYQLFFKQKEKHESIHISPWPRYDKSLKDENLEKAGDRAIEVIRQVRQFKTKNNKSLKEPIVLTLEKSLEKELRPFLDDINAVTTAKEIVFSDKFSISF